MTEVVRCIDGIMDIDKSCDNNAIIFLVLNDKLMDVNVTKAFVRHVCVDNVDDRWLSNEGQWGLERKPKSCLDTMKVLSVFDNSGSRKKFSFGGAGSRD